MYIEDINIVKPSTGGWVEVQLPSEALDRLKGYISGSQDSNNGALAGNIELSTLLVDKDDWFFKEVLHPSILAYETNITNLGEQVPIGNFRPYILQDFWVNRQTKYQFNPPHVHSGVYSFVVWITIPTDWRKEHDLNFVRHSNSPCSSNFAFYYTNMLGKIVDYQYKLDESREGTLLLFPSGLTHQVFPFYSSDRDRVSVSGNIML